MKCAALAQSLVGVDADAVRMATDQLLHLAGASSAEGVEGPAPGGWQAWAKAVSASSAGCGPPGAHATPGDDASGALMLPTLGVRPCRTRSHCKRLGRLPSPLEGSTVQAQTMPL